MSLYINNTWVHQQGRYWMARAIAFSEKGNDVTISACHDSPRTSLREAGRRHEGAATGARGLGRIERTGFRQQTVPPKPAAYGAPLSQQPSPGCSYRNYYGHENG